MSRRHAAEKREILPDAKYKNIIVAKVVNCLMYDGRKSVAEGVVYGALDTIAQKTKKDAIEGLMEALKNLSPSVEVKSRRIGGATYQVPVEVRPARGQRKAIAWLIECARGRSEKTMTERLAGEMLDALNGRGSAVKKREETHKMAEANKAFAHYRF